MHVGLFTVHGLEGACVLCVVETGHLRLGSHLREIFEMSEDIVDNFVLELVRDN